MADPTFGERHLKWWRARLDEPCFVYVVQAQPNTPVKVGTAKNVAARIATLQTGNPYKLRLLYVFPGDHELEWQLHQKLSEHRLEGEWFAASEATFSWMKHLADAMVTAYRHDGQAPSYRQRGFQWKRYAGTNTKKFAVRFATPAPVPKQEAEQRLALRRGSIHDARFRSA